MLYFQQLILTYCLKGSQLTVGQLATGSFMGLLIRYVIGLKASQAIVLNAMGYDGSDGKIMLDKDMNKICFSPPHDPLLPKKIKAFQKLSKKLGGILFLSRY